MSTEHNCFEIKGDDVVISILDEKIDKLHNCDLSDIINSFSDIAEYLIKSTAIKSVTDKIYFITELEFYYYKEDHNDCYCYAYDYYKYNGHNKNEEHPQKFKRCWFYHPSGMDITIGNEKNIFGGILIRSLCDDKGFVTCGPINVRGLLLDLDGSSIEKKNKKENYTNISNNPKLINVLGKSPFHDKQIIKTPRCRLNSRKEKYDKDCSFETNFYCRPYRFLIDVKCGNGTTC